MSALATVLCRNRDISGHPAVVSPGSGCEFTVDAGETGSDGLQGRGILFGRGLPWKHRAGGRIIGPA